MQTRTCTRSTIRMQTRARTPTCKHDKEDEQQVDDHHDHVEEGALTRGSHEHQAQDHHSTKGWEVQHHHPHLRVSKRVSKRSVSRRSVSKRSVSKRVSRRSVSKRISKRSVSRRSVSKRVSKRVSV